MTDPQIEVAPTSVMTRPALQLDFHVRRGTPNSNENTMTGFDRQRTEIL
jgi:hypothetical protein